MPLLENTSESSPALILYNTCRDRGNVAKKVNMTTEEIVNRIEYIQSNSHDAESAHAAEDKLREDFIESIASAAVPSNLDTQAIILQAQLVLTTKQIEFERWCA